MKEREMTEQEIAEQESKAYKTLDVPMDASESDIKRAYRVLARKYHPDKNPNDPTAAEKFTEIQNAYDILSNKKITTDLAFEIADAIHEIAYEEKLFLIQPDSNDKFDADDQLLRETLISDILLLLSKYDISPSSVKELLEKNVR